MSAKLYYIHDPMCSWCWGFKPCWDELKRLLAAELGDSLLIVPLVGGLAPDTDVTMPAEQQATITNTWKTITQQLGTRFNFDFWSDNTPRRSTYMSCRAVLAAEAQKASAGEDMLLRIQEAYYLKALNPSDTSTLVQLAADMGLDVQLFREALSSRDLQVSLRQTFRLVRRLPIQGFPSLVFVRPHADYSQTIPIQPADILLGLDQEQLSVTPVSVDYRDPAPMFEAIKALSKES